MTESDGVELLTIQHETEHVVAAARGELTLSTASGLNLRLGKLLVEGVPVLLDVSELQMTWTPGPEVFITAVSAAGGWPLARLVLFGADGPATGRLQACRVTESVPLARSATEAAALVDVRPSRLMCGRDFPADRAAVFGARQFLRDVLRQWDLPERDDADAVVTELVTNAVEHAGTSFRMRLVLDGDALRVSVRDRNPGPLPDVPGPQAGRGLRRVARLSRSWGVLHFADGKSVWAGLPLSPRSLTLTSVRSDDHDDELDGIDLPDLRPTRQSHAVGFVDMRSATAVTEPRRQSFATADPEHAHEFLRSVYGEHRFRLSGRDDFHGFRLDYDGTSTNRFAVDRLTHTLPFEGLFAPARALVVAHVLDGDLHVGVRHEEQHAGPGDVLLVDAGTDTRVSWHRLDLEAVRLDPVAVALVAADLTGLDPALFQFDLSRPVSPARAAHWRSTVRHLRNDVLADDEVMVSPLSRATILRHVVATLVETFPSPALDALAPSTAEEPGKTAPSALRRATRFIDEHAHDDIGLAEIAAAARVGARALQLAFRRHHDLTPLEYLRRVRLERAHHDLRAGNRRDDTVASIATRWGFTHHGNFSAAYLRAYGCSPSITLRS